ncbi:hypothetical protein P12x_002884 [Tundrisphaera lichenicola]|uniref:hypothetical protein n=1 Tax=Tundrisphaera lichenicola TaxID=2029860 RepID=UPI003EBFBCA5
MILAIGLVTTSALGQRPKAKARDKVVGTIWKFTAIQSRKDLKDGTAINGRFRVYNYEVFHGIKKIGYIKPDGPLNSQMVLEDHPKLNGIYQLTRVGKRPEIWAGEVSKSDGSKLKVRFEVVSY